MVDKNIIVVRIEQIEKHLKRIFSYRNLAYEDFLKDNNAQDIVEYNLFQIVNHLIDIIQHIVIDEDYGFPQTAYEASRILCDKGILDEDSLKTVKKMIGFRNIVGHDYIRLNKEVVYFILTEGTKDIRELVHRITKGIL